MGDGPRKVFVGSLPNDIAEPALRKEFDRYGQIVDVFIKTGCETGRQWAFINYATADQALAAKEGTDRILTLPGADRACEVMLAKNQGKYGQEPVRGGAPSGGGYGAPREEDGPKKVFVGSLPDDITESILRREFDRYGQVVDVFIKTGCEAGRQWAFINFASSGQALAAKDATDRKLILPGATTACEVMLAKNQGKNGQDPIRSGASGGGVSAQAVALGGCAYAPLPGNPYAQPVMAMPGYPMHPYQAGMGYQPPPPTAPPPAHLTPWRCYHTAAGLPYYHNHTTGLTQWECPMEFQVAAAQPQQAIRYAPY